MTRDEIVRIASEAGCLGPGLGGDPDGLWEPSGHENVTDLMFRFATLVAAAEREACAKVCEETTAAWTQHLYNSGCVDCAAAIRSRSQA